MLKIKPEVDLKELEKYGFGYYTMKITDTKTGKSIEDNLHCLLLMHDNKIVGSVSVDKELKTLVASMLVPNIEDIIGLTPLVEKLIQAGLVENE